MVTRWYHLWIVVSMALGGMAQTSFCQNNNNNSNAVLPVNPVVAYYRAAAEYQYALSMSQLNYAKANLANALAASEWERARELSDLVARLEFRLRQINKRQGKLESQIKRIEAAEISAKVIMAGSVQFRSLSSIKYLTIHAADPAKVFEVMTSQVQDIPPEDFVGAKAKAPFAGKNIGQLLEHLLKNNLSVTPWGTAHQYLCKLLIVIAEGAAAKLAEVRSQIDHLDDNINPFDLPRPRLDDEDDDDEPSPTVIIENPPGRPIPT